VFVASARACPDFHGLRDFFAFVKAVCKSQTGYTTDAVLHATHRNFGGSQDPTVTGRTTRRRIVYVSGRVCPTVVSVPGCQIPSFF